MGRTPTAHVVARVRGIGRMPFALTTARVREIRRMPFALTVACALVWHVAAAITCGSSGPLAAYAAAQTPATRATPEPATAARKSPQASLTPATRFDTPLARGPLDPPLGITGGYGEYRIGHFHAGFDFSTGGHTGLPVYSPLTGHIERIRTSGVGYGRSLYVRATDGRLLQFGHLDAFEGTVAAYAAFMQDSSGQYEQDLWPATGRFPVVAGQRIAWSGNSGAGGPHLHFEIRRGDMTYHPQRAGLRVSDRTAPTIARLTLEPLDDVSYVGGQNGPVTITFGANPETLAVLGRVRAIVDARDGAWAGVDRMVPWSTAMAWDGHEIECRFDSISWASDMPEGDYVYDAGRVIGEKGIVLWAPSGFRPRAIRTDISNSQEAGTITVRPADAPRTLRLAARDAAGHRAERSVVIRAAATRTPVTTPEGSAIISSATPECELAVLPNYYLRVRCEGIPDGIRNVVLGWNAIDARARSASRSGRAWSAVLPWRAGVALDGAFLARGTDAQGHAWEARGPAITVSSGGGDSVSAAALRWRIERNAAFDGAIIARDTSSAAPAAPAELTVVRRLGQLAPATLVLRRPITLEVVRPVSDAEARVGLYRHDGERWTWVSFEDAAARGRLTATTRSLGWFALLSDTLAPRITLRAAPKAPRAERYPRWAIEAALVEGGSGVDARGSYFIVDGRRVAAEWDSEADVLRWRPHRRPARGEHRYSVIATDRAGNSRVRSDTFAIE